MRSSARTGMNLRKREKGYDDEGRWLRSLAFVMHTDIDLYEQPLLPCPYRQKSAEKIRKVGGAY